MCTNLLASALLYKPKHTLLDLPRNVFEFCCSSRALFTGDDAEQTRHYCAPLSDDFTAMAFVDNLRIMMSHQQPLASGSNAGITGLAQSRLSVGAEPSLPAMLRILLLYF